MVHRSTRLASISMYGVGLRYDRWSAFWNLQSGTFRNLMLERSGGVDNPHKSDCPKKGGSCASNHHVCRNIQNDLHCKGMPDKFLEWGEALQFHRKEHFVYVRTCMDFV